MLLSFVMIVVITSMLVLGWQWYFREVANRQALAQISAKVDENIAEKAAVRADKVKATAFPEMVESPGPPSPSDAAATEAVSLVNLTKVPDEGDFPDPMPLTAEVSPERHADAMTVQQKFWQATTWKDKLPFVHDAARVGPQMQAYYEIQHKADPVAGTAARQAHFMLNNTEVLLVSYGSPRPGGSVEVAMLAQPDGRFLIDWESYVGAGEIAWPDLKKTRPTEPRLLRLFAQRDDYYNYEFADAAKFHSLHLTSPDGLYFIYGFVEKGTPLGTTIANLLEAARGRAPLTLRVEFPAQAQSDHCLKIVGIVANRWLLVK